MSIQQRVILRYRSAGHVRFDLPSLVCSVSAATQIVRGLSRVEGVYRVSLSENTGKLSIRYDAAVCSFAMVARRLHDILQALPAATPATAPTTHPVMARALRALPKVALPSAVTQPWTRLKQWSSDKYQETRETVWATRIVSRRAVALVKRRPDWVTEFLNDALMLYLLKIHWHRIAYEWLPNPWRFRYEWAATVYMIHLLVRSKLPPDQR